MKNKKKLNVAVFIVVVLVVALFAGYKYANGDFSTQTDTQPKQDTKTTQKEQTTKSDQTKQNASTKERESENKQKDDKPTPVDTNGNEDFKTMKRPTVDEVTNAQKNLAEASSQFVGSIEVPKIGLQLHVLEGCTYQKMLYGATTLLSDEVMGQGNYALASHNMGVEHSMFTSIYQLQAGDDIFLTNQTGQRFHYRVTTNRVADFKDTTCLQEQEQPVVTLVTCQSVQTTPNRVVVQGTLVND